MKTFREEVIAARGAWMEDHPPEDGHDHVTPFDRFLYDDTPPGEGGAVSVPALQSTVHGWANATFPGRQQAAAWLKLFEELGEVIKSPHDPLEWGDVFIMLLDLATMNGVDVMTAVLSKLEINQRREWRQLATGVFSHVDA